MKKFILILFLIIYPINSIAHIGHYSNYKKIEIEIYRNEKLIGYNYYFFSRKDDVTTITNQIKFSVKILGTTIFQIEGYGEEKYMKDQLISYNSKTLQNNKKKFVNLLFDKDTKKLNITGSSYNGEVSKDIIIGNWWNHKILQSDIQISPLSGSVKKQVVTFIGKEKIDLYGKTYEVDRFTIKSKDQSLPEDKKLDFDIWYDQKRAMILKISYSKMGDWEYRLKNFE